MGSKPSIYKDCPRPGWWMTRRDHVVFDAAIDCLETMRSALARGATEPMKLERCYVSGVIPVGTPIEARGRVGLVDVFRTCMLRIDRIWAPTSAGGIECDSATSGVTDDGLDAKEFKVGRILYCEYQPAETCNAHLDDGIWTYATMQDAELSAIGSSGIWPDGYKFIPRRASQP